MPWTRVAPSSPVARSPVIVMANDHTKEEMDEMLGEAMAERGIDPKRTRIGWDIVCRVGNPCKIHDLQVVRVNAHNATSIIAMMTESDHKEEEESDGRVKDGARYRSQKETTTDRASDRVQRRKRAAAERGSARTVCGREGGAKAAR